MILTSEQILSVSFGAVVKYVKGGDVHFQKCTDKQVKAWDNIRADLGERARATTGVKLDFYTDGKKLKFAFKKGRRVEVYIDNLFRGQFLMDEYRAQNKVVEMDIADTLGDPYDKARVTIYFPAHDEPGVIDFIEIDGATFVEPYKHTQKFLIIGDSITQGWESYTDTISYAQRVTRHFDAESVINGIGGAIFDDSTFDSIDFDPDVVILAYGTNDFGYYKNGKDMQENVEKFMALISNEYKGKKIFVISPVWRTDGNVVRESGTFKEARARVINTALKFGFIHIDGLKLIPPLKEYFTDNVHPNELGFSFYAENLIMQLKKYI